MSSRAIKDLDPNMQEMTRDFLKLCKKENLDVLIYCTHRSFEEQAKLFRQSRPFYRIKQKGDELAFEYGREDLAQILYKVGPQFGPHVTNAGPGQSAHNYRCAFDGVPMQGGKPCWDASHPLWQVYGKCGREAGLEWAGDWISFIEYPHMQYPGLDWRQMIRK